MDTQPTLKKSTRPPWRTALLAAVFLAAILAGGDLRAQATEEWQWLEAPHDARALAWVTMHSDAATKALQALPGYAGLRAELAAKLQLERSSLDSTPLLVGARALRFKRDVGHPLGLLQSAARNADGTPGQWQTVLDIGALGRSEGKSIQLQFQWFGNPVCPQRNERCLLRFSEQGSDEASLREFDLASGAFVPGGFLAPASRLQADWLDQDTLLISHTLENSPRTAAGWGAEVRLWKRGEVLAKARVVFTAPPTDAILVISSAGPAKARRGLILRALDYSTFKFLSVDAAGRIEELPLPAKLKPFGAQALSERHLFVQLAEPAWVAAKMVPAETVLAWDLQAKPGDPAGLQVVYTPGPGEVVPQWTMLGTATRTRAIFPLQKGLKRMLLAARYDGKRWSVSPFLEAAAGCDVRALAADPQGEDVLVQKVGFLQPATFEIQRPGQKAKTFASDPTLFDASRLLVEVSSARSADGTPVSYWLVRPAKPATPGQTPTLMTGYGAFGMSFPPGYADEFVGGVTMAIWLERGGALVIPAIRGGGEGGEAWHRAAMREKRMSSYADFIAVAEDLVANKFTRPERLGVFGMSNGGLLSAVVATQRPDLFGAAISDVPLIDMLRFPKMGMGAAWTDEYGNPDEPALRAVLLRYSPFHNIKPGVTYPPFLVTVSTFDNRVGPGHARKLAGRLESVGGEVYYLEEQSGGHGVSDPLQHPDLMAMRLAFLFAKLMPKR